MVDDVLLTSGAWDRVTNQQGFSTGSGSPTSTLPAVQTMLPTTGVASSVSPSLDYYVEFTLEDGTELTVKNDDLFQLSSFNFSDEQTLNIGSATGGAGAGKVTFNPLTLSFTQQDLAPQLFHMLAAGIAFKEVDVLGYSKGEGPTPAHLVEAYSFGLAAGKTLSVDNTGTDQLSLEYGSEAIRTYTQNADGSYPTTPTTSASWNRVTNTTGFSTGGVSEPLVVAAAAASTAFPVTLPTTGVASSGSSSLDYYVEFTLQNGTELTVNKDDLFQLTSFDFDDEQTLNIGSATGGAGAGKVTFNPLTLSFTQQDLAPQLFQMLAAGMTFKEVDVLGYSRAVGATPAHLVEAYSFGLAAGKTLSVDNTGTDQLSLEYGSEAIRSYTPNADGSSLTDPTASASWNRITNTSGFSTTGASEPLVVAAAEASTAFPLILPTTGVAHSGSSSLDYYVEFTLQNGTELTVNKDDLFQLSSFGFEDEQTLNIGSATGGAGAGKVTFDPLNLSFTQQDLAPQLFQMLAAGMSFKEVDVLGYSKGEGPTPAHLVEAYSFGLAAGKSLSVDNTGTDQLSLEYGSEAIRSYTQNADGSYPTTPTTSASWNRVANTSGFSTGGTSEPLVVAAAAASTAFPVTLPTTGVAHSGSSSLDYYVEFTLQNGTELTVNKDDLFQLSSLGFEDEQTLNIGSTTGGAGAGKVTFDPLNLSFTQQGLAPQLFQMLAAGMTFKEVDVLGYTRAAGPTPAHLVEAYSFGLAAGKTLSVDNTGTDQLSLEYGSEAIRTYTKNADGSYSTTPTTSASWNRVTNTSGFSTGASEPLVVAAAAASAAFPVTLPTTGVAHSGSSSLDYYVEFTLQNGTELTVNKDDLFQLTSFGFEDEQTLNIGSATGGAGAGKVTFDPLNLSFTQQGLAPKLFQMLAAGMSFKEVDVLGYSKGEGPTPAHLVEAYSFGLAAGKSLSVDNTGTDQFSLEYGSEAIRSYTQNADGSYSTTPTTSASWNRVTNTTGFSTGASEPLVVVAAAASTAFPVTLPTTGVAPSASPSLNYYVDFTLQNGTELTVNKDDLFQLSSFSFNDEQTLNIGSATAGAGAGKVTFNPLSLSFTQQGLAPQLFQMLAAGMSFKEVDVLGYTKGEGIIPAHLVDAYNFGLVAAQTIAANATSTDQLSLEYGSEAIREYALACYCAGTQILTTRGDRKVEDLRVGDRVVTASGARRPITWVGSRRLDITRHPAPQAVWPVRVSAGAFGLGRPCRDLWMSPGHNVFVEGVLVPIRALINGATVVQVPVDTVTYWHVELESHDVVLAEGLPAESYLDTGNRTAFENGGAFLDMHPDFEPKGEAETCAPLVKTGPAVAAVKARLLAEAEEAGFATTTRHDLHLVADGRRVDPIDLGSRRFIFVLPQTATRIALTSRTFVPCHMAPASTDSRVLGVAVKRLQVDGEEIDLRGDPAAEGWHRVEEKNGRVRRWTSGVTPLPGGTRIVVLELAADASYWIEQQDAGTAFGPVQNGAIRAAG